MKPMMKCCKCGRLRILALNEIFLMKNLPCVCGARLKIVGIRPGLSKSFYLTESEDESLDV